jgi:hypothetical protein
MIRIQKEIKEDKIPKLALVANDVWEHEIRYLEKEIFNLNRKKAFYEKRIAYLKGLINNQKIQETSS